MAIEQKSLEGAVNVVAPGLVSQAEFARAVAGCHAFCLHLPASAIAAIAGEAATLLLGGQAASPRRLLAAGFRFKHPTLGSAMAALQPRPERLPPSPSRALQLGGSRQRT